jgi:hypothetical protein
LESKDAGVEQLEFVVLPPALGIDRDELVVGKRALRILVEILHVRVRGRGIEVEVVLLHVLAVIALAVGQAEQPFLEDRVTPVPQRNREAEPLLVVRDAGEPVLAPAIRARSSLVVREVVPRVAALAIVLAHRAPLPFAQVGPPLPPAALVVARCRQPAGLRTLGLLRL